MRDDPVAAAAALVPPGGHVIIDGDVVIGSASPCIGHDLRR
ncbi:hypothetical protein [Nonomuraea coxensis]|nr:hypothetical protein [Nonomuraea coxensis]